MTLLWKMTIFENKTYLLKMIIVLPIFHAWLNSSQLDSLAASAFSLLGGHTWGELLGTPLCIIVRMQVERQRLYLHMLRKTVWPHGSLGGVQRLHLLWGSGIVLSVFTGSKGNFLQAGLFPPVQGEDSTLFLLCFNLGCFLSQTSLILSLHFLPFSPNLYLIVVYYLLGSKAILILKLHIGDQTSKKYFISLFTWTSLLTSWLPFLFIWTQYSSSPLHSILLL